MEMQTMKTRVLRGLLCVTAIAAMGCAQVKPYERGELARKCMQSPFSRSELRHDYENKVQQTATAAELPGGTPGGGCGCTQ
jgi:hypothetical protein